MRAPVTKVETIEEGNYIATIYKIVYMGEIEGEYKGKKTSSYKINITWELPSETKVWKEGEEAKPVSVSKMYTLSMGSKANLRKVVESIMGGMTDAEAEGFDLDELLGKSCMLNISYGVSETGKEKQNLTTAKIPKGMGSPSPYNKQVILSYQNWNEEVFQALPEWMRKEMEGTLEYKVLKGTYVPTPAPKGYEGELADSSINYNAGEVDIDAIPF